jgi:hypothetical protein
MQSVIDYASANPNIFEEEVLSQMMTAAESITQSLI